MSINIKRILIDVKEVLNDKTLINIYYTPDENSINKGYALIIGTKGTPYEYGNFFFELYFPDNYPFSPPKVTYITNDGYTRFHPNLYINGYVCLSILNTWPGEKWSSCQSLRTILITLSSIFDNNPLLYEPAVSLNHPDICNYNSIIKYKKYQITLLKYLDIENIPENFKVFYDKIKESFLTNYNYLLNDINIQNDVYIEIHMYNKMNCHCKYKNIKRLFNINKIKLNK